MTSMRISELAERSGVPATTLRFYESAGLLSCERSANGYRTYSSEALDRLSFIGVAKRFGLALEEIAALLEVWQAGPCARVKADLRPRIAAHLDDAEVRASDLAAFTGTLRRALDHLDNLPDRDEPCDSDCDFPAADHTASHTADHTAGHTVDHTAIRAADTADGERSRWRTAPVACSLAPDGLDARAEAWRALIAGAGHELIPDGVRLRLPIDRAAAAAELAAAEQECCPFFDFRLHLDGPDLHLEVRAPAEAGVLLEELFGPCAPSDSSTAR